MPEMSGLELARHIRADARLARTAIVILGSLGQPFDPREQRALGIAAYGTKPIGRKQLLGVVRDALGGARPRTEPPRSTRGAREGAQAPLPGTGRRILIVEDSPINAEVATEILRTAGYASDIAVDGRKGIDAALARPYDLVLMDCHLPDVDGYEATRRLRALEKEGRVPGSGRLPILALTASASPDDEAACLACGMDDHIAKPIDARRLLEIIAARIEGRSTSTPQPAARPSPTVANLSRAVERLQGNRALLKRIFAQFVEEAPRARGKLREHITAHDRAGAAFVAHRLRGQAASFDADALVTTLGALEAALAREDWAAASAGLAVAESDLSALVSALNDAP
jgi:CheY-like chemotaxis protein